MFPGSLSQYSGFFGVPKYYKLIQSFIDVTSFSMNTYTVVGNHGL